MQLYSFSEVLIAKIMTVHALAINQLTLMATYLLTSCVTIFIKLWANKKLLPKRCFKGPHSRLIKIILQH